MMRLGQFRICFELRRSDDRWRCDCLIPSQVKNGTRNSIATIGMLSGADEMVQS